MCQYVNEMKQHAGKYSLRQFRLPSNGQLGNFRVCWPRIMNIRRKSCGGWYKPDHRSRRQIRTIYKNIHYHYRLLIVHNDISRISMLNISPVRSPQNEWTPHSSVEKKHEHHEATVGIGKVKLRSLQNAWTKQVSSLQITALIP